MNTAFVEALLMSLVAGIVSLSYVFALAQF